MREVLFDYLAKKAYLAKPGTREAAIDHIVWFVNCIALLLLNIFFIGLHFLLGLDFRISIAFCVLVWAITIGASGLFFLQNRTLQALVGGLIGVSASNIQAGAGLVSSLAKSIERLVDDGCGEFAAACGEYDHFIMYLVWLFISVILLFWAPRLVANDELRNRD
jgi:hypothetical protein